MAQQIADRRDVDFVLHEQLQVEELSKHEIFAEFNKKTVDLIISEARNLAIKEILPTQEDGDREGVNFENGQVTVPESFHKAWELFKEGEWLAMIEDPKWGGQGMPRTVASAAAEYFNGANFPFMMYPGLTQGAGHLVDHFGTQEQKETYLENMYTGKWSGTMLLTEPDAGSDVGALTTKAVRNEDGTFSITGEKIFISGGDYQGSKNIVHLVLARIKGAPAGTKGISLFVVPKNRPTSNGSLTPNDVQTVADFEKMGQKGYCTTHLFFGDKQDCHGWLVGEVNQGLKYMFLMMNGARIAVGRGAAAIATAAYHASLNYAHERAQGRKLTSTGKKDVQQEQTLIINHPDVRRMLLLQKAVSEGSLSLVFLTAKYHDYSISHTDVEEQKKYKLLLEILTPVVKTYPSEMGRVAVDNGVQVLGGYGFCSDYILQQYLRDIRIFSIYEGTTGIQSQDLLGRKVTMENGKALQLLSEEITLSIKASMAYESLIPYAKKLGEKLELTQKVLQSLMGYAMKGDYERFLADATPFMEFFSTILVGWLWLDIGREAQQALATGATENSSDFYESKIHTMEFYFTYELPKTTGLAEVLMNEKALTVGSSKKVFV